MKFTIVIPFYNEETSVSPMFKRLVPVCKSLKDFEILCIDDGSTDKTLINLKEEQKNCPQLKIIKFHKNAGQSAAFAAGFKEAAGDIIITLDGDLQNPPEEIPLIVSALNNADMAVGWRHERQDTFSKKIASKLANGLRRYVLDDKVHDTGCSLKGFKKEVAKNIVFYRGMHRFLPALATMQGYKVTEVKVSHESRQFGITKYRTFLRGVPSFFDMLAVLWMRKRKLTFKIDEII